MSRGLLWPDLSSHSRIVSAVECWAVLRRILLQMMGMLSPTCLQPLHTETRIQAAQGWRSKEAAKTILRTSTGSRRIGDKYPLVRSIPASTATFSSLICAMASSASDTIWRRLASASRIRARSAFRLSSLAASTRRASLRLDSVGGSKKE